MSARTSIRFRVAALSLGPVAATIVALAPIDASSASYIAFINNGSTRRLHPDFGGEASPGSVEIYGDGVDHATDLSYPFYPIPPETISEPHWVEGGEPGNVDRRTVADRHVILVDRDNRHLYELYNVFYDGARWHAGSGVFFDMQSNARRPDGWTSADAAGLAIMPGLVRYDEV